MFIGMNNLNVAFASDGDFRDKYICPNYTYYNVTCFFMSTLFTFKEQIILLNMLPKVMV